MIQATLVPHLTPEAVLAQVGNLTGGQGAPEGLSGLGLTSLLCAIISRACGL